MGGGWGEEEGREQSATGYSRLQSVPGLETKQGENVNLCQEKYGFGVF